MTRKFLTAPTLCVLASAAYAESPRSTDYFIAHADERAAIVRNCDPRFVHTTAEIECYNARKAVDEVAAQANSFQRQKSQFNNPGSIYSPLYYDAFPLARAMMLRECASPPATFPPNKLACQAASTSARLAGVAPR